MQSFVIHAFKNVIGPCEQKIKLILYHLKKQHRSAQVFRWGKDVKYTFRALLTLGKNDKM